MSVAIPYGTTFRSAPCSAHSGIGLLRSFPRTPSNVFPSSGPYRRPSMLSSDRFSNRTTTMWSSALARAAELVMWMSPSDQQVSSQIGLAHLERLAERRIRQVGEREQQRDAHDRGADTLDLGRVH